MGKSPLQPGGDLLPGKKAPHRRLRGLRRAAAGDYSGIPLTADELQQIKDDGRVCQGTLANLLKIVQSLLTGAPQPGSRLHAQWVPVPICLSLARGRRSNGGCGSPRYLITGLVHIRAAPPLAAWVNSEPVDCSVVL